MTAAAAEVTRVGDRAARRRPLRLVARLVTGAVLIALVTLLLLLVLIPRALGWVPLTVLSGSMDPAIPAGSQVIVAPIEGEQDLRAVQVGDVVTFMPHPDDDTLVTHRVVSIGVRADGAAALTTRGDANGADDPQPVTAEQVRGLVRYHVPFAGHLAALITPTQKQAGVTVAAVLLFGYAGTQVIAALRRPRDGSTTSPRDRTATGAGDG